MEETKIGLIGEGKNQCLVFVNDRSNKDKKSSFKYQNNEFEVNFKIL